MTTSEDKITTITDDWLLEVVTKALDAKDWVRAPDIAADVVLLMRSEGWVHVVPGEPKGLGDVAIGRRRGEVTDVTAWVKFRSIDGNCWINSTADIARWADLEVHQTRVATEVRVSR